MRAAHSPNEGLLCEQAVAPACAASAKPLHTTVIRNEAAYFGCSGAPLFLLGDSHCLPGWRACLVHLSRSYCTPLDRRQLSVWGPLQQTLGNAMQQERRHAFSWLQHGRMPVPQARAV